MGPLAQFIAPPNLIVRDENGEWVLERPDKGLAPDFRPLIAFVNGKSGSQEGLVLKKQLYRVLNPLQVFDLVEPGMPPGPQRGFNFIRKYGNDFTVLACGGDGTFGWVLESLRAKGLHPRVSVVPLGTGNDLARVLGWGGGFDCAANNVSSVLLAMTNPKAVAEQTLDRWMIHAEPTKPEATTTANDGASAAAPATDAKKEEGEKEEKKEETVAEDGKKEESDEKKDKEKEKDEDEKGEAGPTNRFMNNYWSIGTDAGVALDFHHARESNPSAFNNRMMNKVRYFGIGANQVLQASNRLASNVELTVDGKQVLIPNDIHCLIVLNLPSCYGGRNLWGQLAKRHVDRGLKPIAINDGLIEVVGVRNMMHIANINTGVAMPKKLAQGSTVSFRILSPEEQRAKKPDAPIFPWYPCQFDGEPYEQRAGQTITISFLEQSTMIKKL